MLFIHRINTVWKICNSLLLDKICFYWIYLILLVKIFSNVLHVQPPIHPRDVCTVYNFLIGSQMRKLSFCMGFEYHDFTLNGWNYSFTFEIQIITLLISPSYYSCILYASGNLSLQYLISVWFNYRIKICIQVICMRPLWKLIHGWLRGYNIYPEYVLSFGFFSLIRRAYDFTITLVILWTMLVFLKLPLSLSSPTPLSSFFIWLIIFLLKRP